MAMFFFLNAVVLFVTSGPIPLKHIEVEDINKLTFADKSLLFEPTSYLSSNKKSSQHNINIFDTFGKFIHLNYFSRYGDHVNIFELKPNGLNDVKSVQCVNDFANTMKIMFAHKYSASKYAQIINHHIQNNGNNKYFITGSNDWKCYNKNEKQHTPILREIVSARNDETLLIITSKYASYTDLFECLEMSLVTNAKMDKKAINSATKRRNLLDCDVTPSSSSLWDDIVNGVESLWDAVTSVIDDIADFVQDIEDIYQDATELYDDLTSGDYTKTVSNTFAQWTYNYNGATKAEILDLDSSVSCQSCYAYAALTYTIEITINDYELTYFKLMASGDVKVNIEIEASEKYSDEFSAKTCQVAVPDLGFSIAGIHFGFSIYGEFAVGIEVDMAFSYTIYATASITRGVEYNAATNSQNYISQQSFEHGSVGPVLDFKAAAITVYGRATLYLVLSLVGDVYIGVQPKYVVSLAEDANYGAVSGCSVDYTPSATVTIFVGATIDLAQKQAVWSKQANIETYTLPAGSSGCVTHSEIASLESWADSASSAWWRRRNMLANMDADYDKIQFVVNYTAPKTVYKSEIKWGKKNNLWTANLTAMSKTCGNASIAESGQLIVYPQSNDGDVLYAVYQTVNHISVTDGYSMSTDVHCVARYRFEKNYRKYNTSNSIYRYDVNLVSNDYKCDVNKSIFDEKFRGKIFLPKQMDSILLDSAFNTILVHDVDDCHIFALTKNRKQRKHRFQNNDMDKFENNTFKWSSKAWFGSFHCEDMHSYLSDSSTLYFNAINWKTGDLNGTLLIGNNSTLAVIGKLSMNEDLTLDFTVYDNNNQYVLSVNGVISVLEDGSALFSGVTLKQPKCTGFIFQGFMNTDQFNLDMDGQTGVGQTNKDVLSGIGSKIRSVIGFICLGAAVAFMLVLIVVCVMKKYYGYKFVRNEQSISYALMLQENL